MSNAKTLSDRLKFLDLDGEVRARLRRMKPVLMAAMPGALDKFYQKVLSQPEISGLFSSPELVNSAKARQRAHWDTISDGEFDESYAHAVAKVGQTHARVGLAPRWYIGGYAVILEHLTAAVLRARWPKPAWFARKSDSSEVAAEVTALAKAMILDMELVISVYLDVSETALKTAEDRARAASEAVMQALGEALTALAAGNLTHRIGDALPETYAQLRTDFNAALERLAGTLSGIQNTARVINTGVDEIAQASDDLARRTEQQAASLVQTSAALNELTAAVKRTAAGAAEANIAVGAASNAASNSRGIVTEAGAAMTQIEASSQEIGQIIGLIDDIAFQTNLLALNAGVEAARAGDAGRGFAVVASEVRALAQRSAEAAKAIKTLISTSSAQVAQGVDLVRKTGLALETIVGNVAQIEGLISEISSSAQRQAGGLNEVSEAVNQMNQVVQQNAAMVEQSTAAAHSLKTETGELSRSAGSFKLATGREAPPRQPAPTAPPRRLAVAQAH